MGVKEIANVSTSLLFQGSLLADADAPSG